MDDPNTLKISVAEDIKMSEAGMGIDPDATFDNVLEDGKKAMQDEIARYYEEQMQYIQRYVPPHTKQSRWVKDEDIERVVSEGRIMVNLCRIPHGMYGNANAIAHPQIDDKDPLRFFVINDGLFVVNPVIIAHSTHPVFKQEGCMSFPSEPMKQALARYNRVTVRYQTLKKEEGQETPVLSKPMEVELTRGNAHIFQHECAHLNGHYAYDTDYSVDHSIGYGDGKDVSEVHAVDLLPISA